VARRKKPQVSATKALAGASVGWIFVAIISGSWLAWLAGALFTAATVGVAVRGKRPRSRPPARGRGRTPASGRARSGGGRKPKRAPLTGHGQGVKRASVLRSTRCSAACRTSRKPVYDKAGRMTCDCPCGGSQHGMYQPGSTAHTVRTDKANQRAAGRNAAAGARTASRRAAANRSRGRSANGGRSI
jgi:hypothetical protein